MGQARTIDPEARDERLEHERASVCRVRHRCTLVVASLTISNSSFLYQYDVTPSRLANSIRLFGYSPRVCFAVATGPRRATDALNRLKLAVCQVPDISTALLSCRNGSSVDDTVFEVIPKDEQRLLDCAVVRPVSLLALDILLHDKAKRSNQSVYDIYSELRPLPEVAAFIGMTREHALHRYLRQVQGDFELTPFIQAILPILFISPSCFIFTQPAAQMPLFVQVLLFRRPLTLMEVCRSRVMPIPTSLISPRSIPLPVLTQTSYVSKRLWEQPIG